jgi:hypothetical protein
MKSRLQNEAFKVKNPLQKISDTLGAKVAAGKIDGKDLRRYFSKAASMLEAQEISKKEMMDFLNVVLRQNYSFEGEKGEGLASAYRDFSEVRKDLYEGKEVVLTATENAAEMTHTPESVKINYTYVSERIEKNKNLRLEHIAGAFTTLKADLKENKIDATEAQKHMDVYIALELPENSQEARIRRDMMNSYGKDFEKRGVFLSVPAAKPQMV